MKSLAKARKETRKSPSDRFIHSRRPERPREATNDDRFERGLEIPGNRYEESDSDVEIVGARKLRHVGPSFGDGNGNADGSEFEITHFGMLNKADAIQSNITGDHIFRTPLVFHKGCRQVQCTRTQQRQQKNRQVADNPVIEINECMRD